MAVTRHTLTGAIVDQDGDAFPSYTVDAYVQTNLAAGVALLDTAGHRIQLGTLELDLDATTGAFSIDLVATTSASVSPTGVQYQVVVSYPDVAGNSRYTWRSGWFDLTAETTLDEVATTSFVPPNFQSDFLAAAQALLDAQITLSGIDDSDSEVAGLISNGSLGPLTRAALAALYVGKVINQLGPVARPFQVNSGPENSLFSIDVNEWPNSGAGTGTNNHSVHIGWNAGRHSGGSIVAGRPSAYLGIEDNYFDYAGDLQQGIEFYFGTTTPDGTTLPIATLRPFYARVIDSSANSTDKASLVHIDIGERTTGFPGYFAVMGSVRTQNELLVVNHDEVRVEAPQLTVSPDTGTARVTIKSSNGANPADKLSVLNYALGATPQWNVTTDQFGEIYTFDLVNNRIHMNMVRGATSLLAYTDIFSKVNVYGNLYSQPLAGPAVVAVNACNGPNPADKLSTISFQLNGTGQFQITSDDLGEIYVFDNVNNRNHMVLTRGASDTAANSDFSSNVTAKGVLGVAPAAGTATFEIRSPNGPLSADKLSSVVFKLGGAAKFRWTSDQFSEIFLYDEANGRVHQNNVAAATSLAAYTEFSASIKTKGALHGTGTDVPTVTATGNLGTSPPTPVLTAGSNCLRGRVELGTGTTPAAGDAVTLTFPSGTFPGTPRMIVTGAGFATAGKQPYAYGASATAVKIGFTSAPAASQAAGTYLVDYVVIG